MIPVFLQLLFTALSTATSAENSAGLNFIVAFPENIAYYHPSPPKNRIYITSLGDDAQVTVKTPVVESGENLQEGQTKTFSYDGNVELKKSGNSDRSLKITSTQKVTVQTVSSKNSSVQTALIIPNENLGKKYFIPPVPTIFKTTTNVSEDVTERQPFRLIVHSTENSVVVTVEAESTVRLSLGPHEVGHILIKDDSYRVLTADNPVMVIFGHTCAMRQNCTCSLLYAVLPPAEGERLTFYIPTVVASGAEAETYILLSDEGSRKKEKFNPNSPFVETSGTAILFRPGLLLSLIPETEFAACYLIHVLPDVENYAVIVVHKDVSGGVRIGESPLADPQWEPLTSTDYVSTKVRLDGSGPKMIWHLSSIMGVYFQGHRDQGLFGNPAPVVSKSPDYSGCALSPAEMLIGEPGSWQESVAFCEERGLELISFANADHQKQVYTKLDQDQDLFLLWIGLRRSSLTGNWYWLSGETVADTNWAEDEPGGVQDGQCAIMRTDGGDKFSWSDEDCCKKARPVCYKPPLLFTLEEE